MGFSILLACKLASSFDKFRPSEEEAFPNLSFTTNRLESEVKLSNLEKVVIGAMQSVLR